MLADLVRIFEQARCIVFDFDGVILESEAIKEDGFRDLFRELPDKRAVVDAYLLANPSIPRTIRIPALYELVHGRSPDEGEYEALSVAFSDYVHKRVRRCPEVAGARGLLQRLYGEKSLYVSSATPEGELQAVCEDRDLTSFFAGIYGAPVSKPEHFAVIMDREGLGPEELLFVGDSPADYRAAQATGVRFLARQSNVVLHGEGFPRVSDFEDLVAAIRCGRPQAAMR